MSVALLRQIRSFPDVRIDTGNVHRHLDVLKRVNTDPVEELLASLEYQLHRAANPNVTYGPGVVILAPETEYSFSDESQHFDLKITLKIFLSEWDPRQTVDCVNTALQQLGVRAITQLIICFPSSSDTDADENGTELWLEKALPVWNQLEELVSDKKVLILGVADLSIDKLRSLFEAAAQVRPMITHYSIQDCCAVPQDLREYAAKHDILLLTHNDPDLSELRERVEEKTTAILGDDRLFELGWSARYTVWARSRSLICSKGYILQFQKTQ